MRFKDQLSIAASTGVVVGSVDAVIASARASLPLSTAASLAVLSVGAVSTLAALVVPLEWLTAWLAERVLGRSHLGVWLAPRMSGEPAEPREPVIRFHALIATGCIVFCGSVVVLFFALRRLRAVTEDALAVVSSIGVVIVTLVLALALSFAGARLLAAPLERIDARWGLPFPRHATSRRALFVGVPMILAFVPLDVRYGEELGFWRFVGWIPVFIGLQLLVNAFVTALPKARVGLFGIALVGLLLAAATPFTARIQSGALRELPRATLTQTAFVLLRALTDVDRDGVSSLYGGLDCKAFDSRVSPLARDVPGNGIDENCDGNDAVGRSGGLRRFHGTPRNLGIVPRQYNVVMWVADATRADHCSVTGYGKATTPYLESLADQALIFDNAQSQSTATMLSLQSLLVGMDPGSMNWIEDRGKLQAAAEHVTLAEHLKQRGYRTLMVSDGYIRKRLPGAHQGFDRVVDSWLDGQRMPWYSRHAAVASSLAISLLEEDAAPPRSKAPFFLLVYSADPHDPYERHTEGFPDFGSREIDRYDSEIAFTDRYVGFLIDYLRYQRPLWDNTIFVFTSDHGEEFHEHGERVHGYTCHHQATHVPIVFRIPGIKGRHVASRVALVDIVPTLFEALGIDDSGAELDGQSLLIPSFEPNSVDPARPVFCGSMSQAPGRRDFFARSVRSGDRALVNEAVAGTYKLYDTLNDPNETNDLSGLPSEAERLARLKELLGSSITGNLSGDALTR